MIHILLLSIINEIVSKSKRMELFHVLVEQTKYFDTVPREAIYRILRKSGVNIYLGQFFAYYVTTWRSGLMLMEIYQIVLLYITVTNGAMLQRQVIFLMTFDEYPYRIPV